MTKKQIKLNESEFEKLVKETVKIVLKESATDEFAEKWFDAVKRLGEETMLVEVFNFFYQDDLERLLDFVDEKYNLGIDLYGNKSYARELGYEDGKFPS